jgi:GNAT superfamily N-acetyltransferase
MRIVEHDEISSDLEGEVQLLDLCAGWGTMDFHRTKEARKLGYPAADYFGVYAIEDGRILSAVRVLRLPYTLPEGQTETVSAIQGVTTRRDRRGLGLGRELLNEVHTRERRAGNRFSLLWTSRSNTAHWLYESIGYRDVYTPDLATRRIPRRTVPQDRCRLAKVEAGDVAKIERIHATATQGRIGFTPRDRVFLRSRLELGFVRPDSFRLVIKEDRPIGYIELRDAATGVKVSEVVMTGGSSHVVSLLSALERLAAGRWLTLWNTFVRDSKNVLSGRGYAVSDFAYYSLMALPLDKSSFEFQESALGTIDPRFVCQALDYF